METRSTIDDPVLLERIAALSHGTPDPTGNWIGGGRPHTNLDIPVGPHKTSSKAFARWSAVHYAFYEELMRRDCLQERRDGKMDVLDLGCAGGARTKQIQRAYGGNALGLDRDASCIEFALNFNGNEDVGFLRVEWPKNGGAGRIDRIFAVEFFEHFKPADQVAAIAAAVHALAPDGMLFLTMPNEPPQPEPHEGTRETRSFVGLIQEACQDHGCSVIFDCFDNAAPGDPTDLGWRPIGPRASHNVAVVTRHR